MSPIMQGLSISISGLIITFTALGLFILVMVVLLAIFKEKPAVEELAQPTEVVVEKPTAPQSESNENELIAAITAAVLLVRAKSQSNLGNELDNGKTTWWVSNRLAAQQGIGLRIKRSGK